MVAKGHDFKRLTLVAALNQLFVRVSQTREREQRFTADAPAKHGTIPRSGAAHNGGP